MDGAERYLRSMYAIGIILLISPLSMANLSAQHIKTIKDAAKKLTGVKRRAFQAQVAIDYLNSKPHLAEKTFGWDRRTVALGLNELRTGLVCFDDLAWFNLSLKRVTLFAALKSLQAL